MDSPHKIEKWLRQKYEVEGLSTYAIGRLVGRDPKCVYTQLRRFGITTRPRGMNLRGPDNYVAMNPGKPGTFSGKTHSAATIIKLRTLASRPKPWLRGSANGMAGRTGNLNPRYRDGSSPERQRMYARGDGRAFLRAILARDNYRCRRCNAGNRGPKSLHVHHRKPWAGNPTLRFDGDNAVTLCKACHDWVHSRKNVEGEFLG